jgi:hypothetical protein
VLGDCADMLAETNDLIGGPDVRRQW